jgi:hypothetical protein
MPRPDDAAPPAAPVTGPRLGTAWAALTYAVATLALGWPALAGRFLVNSNSDQYIAGFPFRQFAADYLRTHGDFPLWNPYLFGGMPFVAAMHGDIFYPTFLLRLIMPADAGMTWGMILHVFLAGLFAFLFLRRLGVGFWGALVGGLAYLMGGNVAGLVSPGHDGKIFVSALLPLVLLFVHRAVRGGRAWAWGALAIAVTLAVLTPHPQLLQYLLLVAGAYAVFLAFTADDEGRRLPRNTALARVGLAALAVGVGLLGGAIQFWPVLEYTAWSPRAGGKGWEHAISYSMPPEELINTYLPQFSGVLDRYTGRNGIHLHSEYLGAGVLVLAGLALGVRVARTQRRFWAGVLVVSVLWALGGFTPFYHIVYALVPGTKYFRAPSTMLYVVQFATAVLAAYGADRLIAGRATVRSALVATGIAVLVALLATSGALTNVAAAFVAAPQLAPLVDQNASAVTLGAWRSLLAVLAVSALVIAAARGSLRPRTAGALLAGIVALDLWSIERLYWQFSPPAAQLYAGDPVLRYLETHSDSGRVVPLALEELARGPVRDPYFGGGDGRAGGLMVHDVRSAVGYHGNELGNYQRLSGWATDWPRQMGNANFWKLANVRYLYTNVAQPPVEGATLVAGPARDVVGTMTYLYRLPGDNPPAWLAPIAVKAPDEAVLGTVLDPRFDVRRAAIFDSATAVPTQAVPAQLPAALDLTVRLTAREPGRLAFSLDAPAPAGATLLVSENYYPGWTASVDGRPALVGRADYTLLGVPLPAGARQVVLTFTSPRYETGKAVTLGVLALAMLAIGAGLVLDRRRRV